MLETVIEHLPTTAGIILGLCISVLLGLFSARKIERTNWKFTIDSQKETIKELAEDKKNLREDKTSLLEEIDTLRKRVEGLEENKGMPNE